MGVALLRAPGTVGTEPRRLRAVAGDHRTFGPVDGAIDANGEHGATVIAFAPGVVGPLRPLPEITSLPDLRRRRARRTSTSPLAALHAYEARARAVVIATVDEARVAAWMPKPTRLRGAMPRASLLGRGGRQDISSWGSPLSV